MKTSNSKYSHPMNLTDSYQLRDEDIENFERNGFVRLLRVFSSKTLSSIRETVDALVEADDKVPLEDDSAYQAAFTQVSLQMFLAIVQC